MHTHTHSIINARAATGVIAAVCANARVIELLAKNTREARRAIAVHTEHTHTEYNWRVSQLLVGLYAHKLYLYTCTVLCIKFRACDRENNDSISISFCTNANTHAHIHTLSFKLSSTHIYATNGARQLCVCLRATIVLIFALPYICILCKRARDCFIYFCCYFSVR